MLFSCFPTLIIYFHTYAFLLSCLGRVPKRGVPFPQKKLDLLSFTPILIQASLQRQHLEGLLHSSFTTNLWEQARTSAYTRLCLADHGQVRTWPARLGDAHFTTICPAVRKQKYFLLSFRLNSYQNSNRYSNLKISVILQCEISRENHKSYAPYRQPNDL